MKSYVPWIAAQADDGIPKHPLITPLNKTSPEKARLNSLATNLNWWEHLPAHNFSAARAKEERLQEDPLDRNPDLWLYRDRTAGLLRRYMRFSLETGRLPSCVGHEFFRGKVTAYPSVTFEDRIIFVRDVECCLNRLEEWDQQLIARIILQEHNHDDAARILHCDRKRIQRRVSEVLDLLSEEFLRVKLLVEVPPRRRNKQ